MTPELEKRLTEFLDEQDKLKAERKQISERAWNMWLKHLEYTNLNNEAYDELLKNGHTDKYNKFVSATCKALFSYPRHPLEEAPK